MTASWRNDGSGWRLLAPTGFPDEAALHALIHEAPQILPLSGTPQLAVVGREVLLGNGYADLIAVEPSGRLAIIEVKLSRNAEARRAVVAQVLTYAAYLKGMSAKRLEQDVLARHLSERNYQSLAEAVVANDQAGSFDAEAFASDLGESLSQGRFRLVFVLDEAPEELVRLVGYLETIGDKLLIDLVVVSSYRLDGTQILVPQRVDAERQVSEPTTPTPRPAGAGRYVPGPRRGGRFLDQTLFRLQRFCLFLFDAVRELHQPVRQVARPASVP